MCSTLSILVLISSFWMLFCLAPAAAIFRDALFASMVLMELTNSRVLCVPFQLAPSEVTTDAQEVWLFCCSSDTSKDELTIKIHLLKFQGDRSCDCNRKKLNSIAVVILRLEN